MTVTRALVRIVVYPIIWFIEWAAPHYRDQEPERVEQLLARTHAMRARLRGTAR